MAVEGVVGLPKESEGRKLRAGDIIRAIKNSGGGGHFVGRLHPTGWKLQGLGRGLGKGNDVGAGSGFAGLFLPFEGDGS